jgi:hypothetical protein
LQVPEQSYFLITGLNEPSILEIRDYSSFWKRVRVARWYIFKPKIPLWVNFKGLVKGDVGMFRDHFGALYGQLVYFCHVVYILHIWSFGIFSLVLVCCTKKNLATLKGVATK